MRFRRKSEETTQEEAQKSEPKKIEGSNSTEQSHALLIERVRRMKLEETAEETSKSKQKKKTRTKKVKNAERTGKTRRRFGRKAKQSNKPVQANRLAHYQKAYANNVSSSKQMMLLAIYAGVMGGLMWLLFDYPALIIIGALLGAVYAKRVVIPYEITTTYEQNALNMRNKLINSLTQILTNPQRSTFDALISVEDRLEGELQTELRELLADLSDASALEVQQIFNSWAAQYEKDIIFGQYLEQLATAIIEGRTSSATLKDIKTYHNDLKRKQAAYLKAKKNHSKEVYTILAMVVGMIALISFGIGRTQYIDVYAHQMIGWGTNAVFLIIEGYFYFQFYSFYKDDDIVLV